MITLEVRSSTRMSDSFVRLTLGGPELRHFRPAGADQGIRLIFPRPGQPGLRMPTRHSDIGLAEMLLWPKATRPHVRNITVRRFRENENELDIEIAAHGDTPMSTWLRSVRPGQPAGIFDIGLTYNPPPPGCWQLLVGDESALPAIASILEQAPATFTGQAFLEVPRLGDVREDLIAPAGVKVTWIARGDSAITPGTVVLDDLRSSTLPEGPFTAWIAGESRLATGLRRHLVNDRGVPKKDITFVGYWREGRSSPG